jgi:Protein of unknown function (DUF2946)
MSLNTQRGLARSAQSNWLRSRALALFAAVAFFLQAFALQAHVHPVTQQASIAGAGKLVVTSLLNSPKVPSSKDDPADCPLCHADTLNGAFVSPASPVLLLPTVLALRQAVQAVMSLRVLKLSHNWQGRAPPSL